MSLGFSIGGTESLPTRKTKSKFINHAREGIFRKGICGETLLNSQDVVTERVIGNDTAQD